MTRCSTPSFYIEGPHRQLLKEVSKNGFRIFYIKDQTEDLCLAAIKQNSYAIAYIRNLTPKICLQAVSSADTRHILNVIIDNIPSDLISSWSEEVYILGDKDLYKIEFLKFIEEYTHGQH